MPESLRRRGSLIASISLILLIAGAVYCISGWGALFPLAVHLHPAGYRPGDSRAPVQGASAPAPGVGTAGHPAGAVAEASPESYSDNLDLLARVISGEAEDEPYSGKVGVGAVLLNRMQSSAFPHTLAGVVFQPGAFESVSNGLIWWRQPSADDFRAAVAALSGWDPTYGALYFWNPSKPVNPWVWTRQILTQIGRQIFAR